MFAEVTKAVTDYSVLFMSGGCVFSFWLLQNMMLYVPWKTCSWLTTYLHWPCINYWSLLISNGLIGLCYLVCNVPFYSPPPPPLQSLQSPSKGGHSPAASASDSSSKTKMQLPSTCRTACQAFSQPTDLPMPAQTGELSNDILCIHSIFHFQWFLIVETRGREGNEESKPNAVIPPVLWSRA